MQRQLNEIVKHGLAAAHAPERPDWTIDQGWERYTQQEHGVWKTLYARQSKLLPGHACDEFVQGMQALPTGASPPGNSSAGPTSSIILKNRTFSMTYSVTCRC